jgi:hypothetical protein
MRANESGIKKPSLAGGHWQRAGRSAFLCASAPHALARPHRLRSTRHYPTGLRRPLGPPPPADPMGLRKPATRSPRRQRPSNTYWSGSLITRATVSRLPAADPRNAIQISVGFARSRCHLHNGLLHVLVAVLIVLPEKYTYEWRCRTRWR